MAELPNWVYDVVIELQRWSDEHPKLYFHRYDSQYVTPEGCGCEALNHVPGEVKAIALAIAEYRRQAERDKAPAVDLTEGGQSSG